MRGQATAQDGEEWSVQRKRGPCNEWDDAKLQWSETLGLTVRVAADAENADVIEIPHQGLEVRITCPESACTHARQYRRWNRESCSDISCLRNIISTWLERLHASWFLTCHVPCMPR